MYGMFRRIGKLTQIRYVPLPAADPAELYVCRES